jgi:hypothetical protein
VAPNGFRGTKRISSQTGFRAAIVGCAIAPAGAAWQKVGGTKRISHQTDFHVARLDQQNMAGIEHKASENEGASVRMICDQNRQKSGRKQKLIFRWVFFSSISHCLSAGFNRISWRSANYGIRAFQRSIDL